VLAELYAALAEPDLLHLVQTAHLVKCPGERCFILCADDESVQ
jgi:hypothetical protein